MRRLRTSNSKKISSVDSMSALIKQAFETETEKLTHDKIMERLRAKPEIFEAEIEKIYSVHHCFFVSGWRPAIGWICGAALLNDFIFNTWMVWLTGRTAPMIDMSNLMIILTSMLGLGMMRTFEKTKGVA